MWADQHDRVGGVRPISRARLADCCSVAAEQPGDAPRHCGFTRQTFNKWSLAVLFTLAHLWVWCLSICRGWLPLPYGSRICQGVATNGGWSYHLVSITPRQSAGRRPSLSSVNFCRECRGAEGKGGTARKWKPGLGRHFYWVTAANRTKETASTFPLPRGFLVSAGD